MARPRASRRRQRGHLDIQQVADRLGCSTRTVRRYLTESRPGLPRLRGSKLGDVWYVAIKELDRFERDWPRDDAEAVAS